MNSNKVDRTAKHAPKHAPKQHPKDCLCGCDQAVTWLDWLLLLLLVLVWWLMIVAAMPTRPGVATQCDASTCLTMAQEGV